MQHPEKVVCCTLCLCMAVAVLSSCSLVYLTFIVYLPAQRELVSGLLDQPVICTTEQRVTSDDCEYTGGIAKIGQCFSIIFCRLRHKLQKIRKQVNLMYFTFKQHRAVGSRDALEMLL